MKGQSSFKPTTLLNVFQLLNDPRKLLISLCITPQDLKWTIPQRAKFMRKQFCRTPTTIIPFINLLFFPIQPSPQTTDPYAKRLIKKNQSLPRWDGSKGISAKKPIRNTRQLTQCNFLRLSHRPLLQNRRTRCFCPRKPPTNLSCKSSARTKLTLPNDPYLLLPLIASQANSWILRYPQWNWVARISVIKTYSRCFRKHSLYFSETSSSRYDMKGSVS